MAGVAGALLAFPAVFALRLAHDDPHSAVLVLLVAPVGVIAALLGWRAGLATAAAAFLLVPAWAAIEGTELHALGYATYGAAFVTAAALGRLGPATARPAGMSPPLADRNRAALQDARLAPLLSARETEVLRLLALGYTNREVAQVLYISDRTVESHRSHIYAKLGCGSRSELVRFALERGLIDTEHQPQHGGITPARSRVGCGTANQGGPDPPTRATSGRSRR